MTSEEFWSLTLEEFQARMDRYNEIEKRWDLRFGVVASTYVNTKLPKGAKPIQPGAFFGYYEPAPEQSDEEMLAAMQAFTKVHNQDIGDD